MSSVLIHADIATHLLSNPLTEEYLVYALEHLEKAVISANEMKEVKVGKIHTSAQVADDYLRCVSNLYSASPQLKESIKHRGDTGEWYMSLKRIIPDKDIAAMCKSLGVDILQLLSEQRELSNDQARLRVFRDRLSSCEED